MYIRVYIYTSFFLNEYKWSLLLSRKKNFKKGVNGEDKTESWTSWIHTHTQTHKILFSVYL